MKHWLLKFAPYRTPWRKVVLDGSFSMRGVRNHQAKNCLAEMSIGDEVFFYHSQQGRAIVGVMKVVRSAYPDPTSSDTKWLTCDFEPVRTFENPIPLARIREEEVLQSIGLIRQPRLSVMPITPEQAAVIYALGNDQENELKIVQQGA